MTAASRTEGLATMDLTTATPAQIDAEIAQLLGLIAEQHAIIERANLRISRMSNPLYVHTHSLDELQDIVAKAWDEWAALMARRAPFDIEFERRGGWERYYLVDASNGHVHYDLSHSRCSRQPATRHYWLTEQSGLARDALVELAGERACTVCFPDAPVAVLRRPSHFVPPCEAEKAAKRAAREAKAAAKRANQFPSPLRVPDGINGHYTELIKTVRAAEIRAVDLQFWAKCYSRAMEAWETKARDQILVALAAKRGTTVAIERAAIDAKYIAKCKREKITP